MKVFRGLSHADLRTEKGVALAIGNFDGVHLGHQALLNECKAVATRQNWVTSVLTFEPHPRAYFAQQRGDSQMTPTRIGNLRDNLNALTMTGVEQVIIQHFNAHFAAMHAQDFIENFLVKGLNVKWLIVGEDFHFGAKRSGNALILQEAGQHYGFEVMIMPNVRHVLSSQSPRVSSSLVRSALAQGDFELTQQLLGRPYMMSGRVCHGQKLGRTLGFPTLNLAVRHAQLAKPAVEGIFVVRVHELDNSPLDAVASLGKRPTIEDEGRMLLEVHVLDKQVNAYGKLVRVEFLKKLRDEEKYTDLATLQLAIQKDADDARAYFKQYHNTPARGSTDRISA